MHSYEEALERIPTQIERIIDLLKDAGAEGVTNTELSQISLKYDARISDLRRKGFVIDVISEGGGVYRYFLIKTPSQDYLFKKAQDEVIEIIVSKYRNSISAYQLLELLDEKDFHIIRKTGWYKKHTLH